MGDPIKIRNNLNQALERYDCYLSPYIKTIIVDRIVALNYEWEFNDYCDFASQVLNEDVYRIMYEFDLINRMEYNQCKKYNLGDDD